MKILETTKKFKELEKCVVSFCYGFLKLFGKKSRLNQILKIPNPGTILDAAPHILEHLFTCSQKVGTCLREGFLLPPSLSSTVGGKSRGYPNDRKILDGSAAL